MFKQTANHMTNPLLETFTLPPFSRIQPEHVVPAIETLLAQNLSEIDRLLENAKPYTWESLVQPIELLDDQLGKAWSPVSHLNSVVNEEKLRDAYSACLPKLSDYGTEIGQNRALFEAYQAVADRPDFEQLTAAQQKVVNNALRDFRLSGVDLPEDKKQRYKTISQKLSELTNRFEENVLDATHAWSKPIEHADALQGLPQSALALARQTAEQREQSGWLLTLEFPCYMAVMNYADDRTLRQEIYTAFCTRASDQGPNAGQWDNGTIMEEVLALRHEKAQLLGFANYAEYSLATKMADSTADVIRFLEQLAEKSLPMAKQDLKELQQFAREYDGTRQLEAWDISYYSEKLRQHRFAFSQEDVKPYFPANRVIEGMFSVVEKLYGIRICEKTGVDTWHPDVQFFEIIDADQQLRGQFFVDLYARPHKRGGAWMDECVTRMRRPQSLQTPVAYLTCNFTPPIGEDPALLTHSEVETLFHEFGHGLHHLLTLVDCLSVSGIHGVAWDAVELPSQFMENWCWETDALALISGHYQTGEPLPQTLFEKMLAAKNFQSGLQMVRQIEFSLFDFRIHMEYDPVHSDRIYPILEQVKQQVAVVQTPAFNRFPNSFTHIFAGGYAAGYYSYKWAEVLSSDAFSMFEENGIFDPETGRAFLTNILEKGGSEDAMDLFVAFRGRKPTIDALLRHSGIAA